MNHTRLAPWASKALTALSALILLVAAMPAVAVAHDRWDDGDRDRYRARIQAERLQASKWRAKAMKQKHRYNRPPAFSNARFYRDNRRYYNHPANRWQQARATNYWRNVNYNNNWNNRW